MTDANGRPRIGVMGGTFDPIHHGHLVAASEVAQSYGLDEVVFVPTGEPTYKSVVTPAEHRYLMTVIATASNPRFTVSRVDIDRGKPTFTITTSPSTSGEQAIPKYPLPAFSFSFVSTCHTFAPSARFQHDSIPSAPSAGAGLATRTGVALSL